MSFMGTQWGGFQAWENENGRTAEEVISKLEEFGL